MEEIFSYWRSNWHKSKLDFAKYAKLGFVQLYLKKQLFVILCGGFCHSERSEVEESAFIVQQTAIYSRSFDYTPLLVAVSFRSGWQNNMGNGVKQLNKASKK